MKPGRNLERLVSIIHESLKNTSGTEVILNAKLEATSGRKREIDVLIKLSVNQIPILIAIECKDHKNRIKAAEIEAFHSKCLRIRGIAKKVFVSTSGYQADALNVGQDFDIDLYELKDIDEKVVTKWLPPITRLVPRIEFKLPLRLGTKEEVGEFDFQPTELRNPILRFNNPPERIPLLEFVQQQLKKADPGVLRGHMYMQFIKGGCRSNSKEVVEFSIPTVGCSIVGRSAASLSLLQIVANLQVWFDEVEESIVDRKEFSKIGTEKDAAIASFQLNEEDQVHIVRAGDQPVDIYLNQENGKPIKLKPLFTYNPETDTFTSAKSSA